MHQGFIIEKIEIFLVGQLFDVIYYFKTSGSVKA